MALPNFGSLVRISGNLIDLAFSKFLSTTTDPQNVKFNNATVSGGLNLGTATGSGSGQIQASNSINSGAGFFLQFGLTDSPSRLALQANVGGAGKPGIELGSGSANRDAKLFRDAPNVLRTPGSLVVDEGVKFSSRLRGVTVESGSISGGSHIDIDVSAITSGISNVSGSQHAIMTIRQASSPDNYRVTRYDIVFVGTTTGLALQSQYTVGTVADALTITRPSKNVLRIASSAFRSARVNIVNLTPVAGG